MWNSSRHRWRGALLLAATFCFARPASAARFLQVYIEQDGNVVAHTFYGSGDRQDAATVWRFLGNKPVSVDEEVTHLEGDPGQPLVQTLEGNVVVRFQHTNRVLAQVQLTTLTLQRADAQA